MNEINWNEIIGFLNDVDDMVEEFTKLFLDIARQSIPTKTITVRDYGFLFHIIDLVSLFFIF
jgi:hypothetical protein